MKTYVFFTKRIHDIGGAEQYIYNKMNYLKKQGWKVLVFSGRNGNILVDDFRQFQKYVFLELRYAPVCYSAKAIRSAVNNMTREIRMWLEPGDECIIESESVIRALWAELVAKKLKCKHFAFPLQEDFYATEEMKKFLKFKYDRHELAGITENSVKFMFDDEGVEARDDTHFSAYCNNVIDECNDRFSSKLDPNADFTIGSLGRLEKPCVIPMLTEVKKFMTDNSDRKFNLLLIGGQSSDERVEEIKALFAPVRNVTLVMTGDMYPVPKSLVDKTDVFVSTAGSATATYRYGKPTIKVTPVTGEAIGITGCDFDMMDQALYDTSSGHTVCECLKRVLFDKVEIAYDYKLDSSYYDEMYGEFARQLSIEQSVAEKKYYETKALINMYPRKKSLKFYKIIAAAGNVAGPKLLSEIMDIVDKYIAKKSV